MWKKKLYQLLNSVFKCHNKYTRDDINWPRWSHCPDIETDKESTFDDFKLVW